MTDVAIGLDIGGTKIAGGLVAADGSVRARARRATPAEEGGAVVDLAAEVCRELAEPLGTMPPVGVGAAGLVDRDGVVVFAPNIAWEGEPLAAPLADALGTSVTVLNDANVALWGEFRVGGASDAERSALMLTLGTGVGGALVTDGRNFAGAHGLAPEFGHIIVREGGAVCPCGNRGCLEAYASGASIGRAATRRAAEGRIPADSALAGRDEIVGEEVTAAAEDGDAEAQAILAEAGFWLGVGIASLVNALDPEVVVLGGGAMAAGRFLVPSAAKAAEPRIIGFGSRPEVPIVEATLGPEAGLVGAGLLALDPPPAG